MPGFNINATGAGPNANVEPAHSHRWLFEFDQVGAMNGVALYAMQTQRPSVEFDVNKMHHGQTQIYMPGKHKWNPINVKFYEILDSVPGGGSTAFEIFMYWAENANTAVVFLEQNKLNKDFRTSCGIYLLDGRGGRVHHYSLSNTWPSKVEPSELVFTNSDISTIQVTLHYDACVDYAGETSAAVMSGA